MAQTNAQEHMRKDARRTRRKHGVRFWPAVGALVMGLAVGVVVLALSGQAIRFPEWARNQVERQMSGALPGGGVRLGGAEFYFGDTGRPRIRLLNVEVTDVAGNPAGFLNEVSAAFSGQTLLAGQMAPEAMELAGAQITIRRATSGEFSVNLGGMTEAATGTAGGILDAIDDALTTGALSNIRDVQASDVTITLEDARSGRLWQATGGRLTLTNSADGVTITVFTEVFNGTEDLADVQLSFRSQKGAPEAQIGVTFQNAASGDIAVQSPALAYLALVDAPISGSMRAEISAEGTLGELAATLEVGAGELRPTEATRPLGFTSARVYLTYDPETARIDFTELSAATEVASGRGVGHADLVFGPDGWPRSMTTQLVLTDLSMSAQDFFGAKVSFASGNVDARLFLDPFRVEIGQAALRAGASAFYAQGEVTVDETGWRSALDLRAPELSLTGLERLWPASIAPQTRRWVLENVKNGRFLDVDAALRLHQGEAPVYGMEFGFEDAEVLILKTFPPVMNATGRAELNHGMFAIGLEEGVIFPETGEPAELGGSTFSVADVRQKPGQASVDLQVDGPLESILRLMNNPPFEILKRSGRRPDMAEAQAHLEANLSFPLKKGMTVRDVAYDVSGALVDVASDSLIPDRLLLAERLDVSVLPERIGISGPALAGALPVDAMWEMPLGTGTPDSGTVQARLKLNSETLQALGVSLPPGSTQGEADGLLSLTLAKDQPPAFTLTSDLVGLGLDIPPLAWSKPRSASGELVVSGLAGDAIEVESLALTAPGLDASGSLDPGSEPGRAVLRLDRVDTGWLDAALSLSGRGEGRPPAIEITGGTIDLRSLPEFASSADQGASIDVSLDEVIVAERLRLTQFRGTFSGDGGFNGRFDGLINGGTAVRGTIIPSPNGPAVRLLSDDGGGVLEDTRLLASARDGAFELILVPQETRGVYNGNLEIGGMRLSDAPALAQLLDAVSIIGLLDEMQGSGIFFDTVLAEFQIAPEQITLTAASAVGPSMGISLDGVYDPASREVDMQGVVSPIYLLNGIGQIFTRRGEGLFGFSFRMTGAQEETRISVNPLSILTPGMFREIFRRPPPELTQ